MDTTEGNIKNLFDKITKNFRIENLAFVMLFFGFILLLAMVTFAVGDTPGFIIDAQVIPGIFSIETSLFLVGGLALITVGTTIILIMKIVMKINKYLFMNIKK